MAQFLIDREIEAPERYSAVQSYRVAMAVLRQQRLFVDVSDRCASWQRGVTVLQWHDVCLFAGSCVRTARV